MSVSRSVAPRVQLFGIEIDPITMQEAVGRSLAWMREPYFKCHVIVTPNLDHVVRLQHDGGMRGAYAQAALVVADGWPVVAASRWLGCPLPERVAGSDFVPALLAAGRGEGMSVFLLGAMPGVAQVAAARIQREWPGVRIAGTHSPPLGFEKDEEACQEILQQLDAARPDFLVVGLGCPKQELWLARYASQLPCKVAIAAGATIDFLAGKQVRAPRWMQQTNLEWAYRLLRDPRRLAHRYWTDAVRFPAIFFRELAARRAV
jgi:N-acetylglucosaminyldiphosphoundecaprenol N-acetyl-beta-D-mannosaminyltransferase